MTIKEIKKDTGVMERKEEKKEKKSWKERKKERKYGK